MRFLLILAAVLGLAAPALAQTPTDTRALLAANTRAFELTAEGIKGPGADFLLAQTERAQFLLMGENHHDRDTPRFAGALFNRLQRERGFRYLAVEQDPLAIDAVNGMKGDLGKIAALARRYPSHIGFASDDDLRLLAEVSKGSRPGDPVLWGLEQAQGATRYLEELVGLAPPQTRSTAQELYQEAKSKETRANQGAFLHDDPTTLARLQALEAAYDPESGSRADRLFTSLITSAEIYSYNRRANAGERVGLYNNTEREALFKRTFLENYRRAAKAGVLPKVMFKFGSWHMFRGRSPGGAYTIGNFAHEFAIAGGMEAYGVDVIPVGEGFAWLEDAPFLAPLFPDGPPATPVMIDLRPLKPWARAFANQLEPARQAELRDYIHAHDAIIVLPGGRKATWDLTGFPVP